MSMPIDAEVDFAPDATEHVDEVGPSQHDTECPPDQSHLQSVTVRRRSLRREILRSIDLDRNQNGSLPTMVVADSPKTKALDEPHHAANAVFQSAPTHLPHSRSSLNFFAAETPAFRHGEEPRPPG